MPASSHWLWHAAGMDVTGLGDTSRMHETESAYERVGGLREERERERELISLLVKHIKLGGCLVLLQQYSKHAEAISNA